jgi:biotin operon repressor/DNA-binding transcriptional MerR regulator
VLAGGVALASAAFAVGSQSGDGSAVAARDGGASRTADSRPADFRGRGGPGPGFSSLADELGVSEAKLRAALDKLRPAGDPHEELAAALAQSLGIDQAKVDAALEQLRSQHEQEHEQRRDEHAAALAKELGLSEDKVRAALDKLKPDGPPGDRRGDRRRGPRAMIGALARELGVSRAKLRAALAATRPDGPPRGGPGGPGRHHGGPGGPGGRGEAMASALADALGVDADRVEQALEDFFEAKHDEFAQKLADELGIDVEKVRDALPPRP